jgi:hypothetical protein
MRFRHMLAVATFVLVAFGAGVASAQPARIPEPYAETPPPPPGARYVWEPGHWHWDGVGWEWHRGRYVIRNVGWHEYVPGHWAQRGAHWDWIPAHWR